MREIIGPLNLVTSFKYLVRIMTELYDDWTAWLGNLCKAREIWERLSRILGREGDNPTVSGIFLRLCCRQKIFLVQRRG